MIKPIVMVNVYKEVCGAVKLNKMLNEVKMKGRPVNRKHEREKDTEFIAEESASDSEEIKVTCKYDVIF